MTGPAPDGSQLCQACGLCCQGALHDRGRLEADEVEPMRRLGLLTDERAEGTVFRLPCPRYAGGRCTVYAERPTACREYACRLLLRYRAGEITWEQGARRIEQVRRLVEAVRRHLGPEAEQADLWRQLREGSVRALDEDAAARLDLAALLSLCHTHFLNRVEPRSVLPS